MAHESMAPEDSSAHPQKDPAVAPTGGGQDTGLAASREQLARDIRRTLGADEPWIDCQYLYDDRGSELFDAITRLPEYYPTRTEEALLAQHADAILERAAPRELAELGSGTGVKVPLLLDAMTRARGGGRLVLFEINEAMVQESVERLGREHPQIEVEGVVGAFPQDLHRLGPGGDRLVLFLGSTLGNQLPERVPAFLRQVAAQMQPGDFLLLGLDLIKDPARLEAAYNDAAGVTAAFNLNLLRMLNRELDADFDLDAWEHVAVWEPEHTWVRIALRARRDQHVRVPGAGIERDFAAGDEIQTEISCKYTRELLQQRLRGTGLAVDQWYTDAREDFAVVLLRRDPDQEDHA